MLTIAGGTFAGFHRGKGRARAGHKKETAQKAVVWRFPGMKCEVCGNDYDKSIEIVAKGESHFFDSFECAIHALAPECAHCGCKVIGHGVEADGDVFCCASCSQKAGVVGIRDRV